MKLERLDSMLTCRIPIIALLMAASSIGAFAGEEAAPAAIDEPAISAGDRRHWAYLPIQRPAIPAAIVTGHAASPLDRFILARLAAEGLTPLPEASRETLVRRLSFDLWGLPPSPAELDTFLADNSPDAYERLVERMMASPRYGERWGQHWLDLARYAETDGYEHDKIRPEAWRYRDWVIDSLNADLPYDRFVQLQIAGDELFPRDVQARVATMFCTSGPDMPDVNSQEERWHDLLGEMTGTVASTFLALQFQCARCHNHRYDAISQADFYRLKAVFAPAVFVKKNASVTWLDERGEPGPSYLLVRGDWRRPGAEVRPAYPRIANPGGAVLEQDADRLSRITSGRRAALALWLTERENPLTARVIVNRLWQHHFGEGLSRTPSDFGVMGFPPSHPQLLDWLAVELIDSGWSLKHLHRLIVTSAAYRRASRWGEPGLNEQQREAARGRMAAAIAADPENELLARFPRRRLEGEAIRDAMLRAGGALNSEMHGPGVMPPLPDELLATLLKGQWETDADPSQHNRRSIYVFARRNLRYPIFESFDRPDANASCAERNRSTTAPQALLMLNSEFSLLSARRLAQRLSDESDDAEKQIESAFRLTFGRLPDRGEMDLAARFLAERELAEFCLALLNASEFIYVD